MKRLIIILLVFAAFAAQSQTFSTKYPIVKQAVTAKVPVHLRDSLMLIGTLPKASSEVVDVFGYVTDEYPSFASSTDEGFITMRQIDDLWDKRKYKTNTPVGNLTYKSKNKKMFAALKNRNGIAVYHSVGIYTELEQAEPEGKIFWTEYDTKIKENKSHTEFWTNPKIDSIVKGLSSAPEIPVIVKDSVKYLIK